LLESVDSSTHAPLHIVPVRHAQLPLLHVGAEAGHCTPQLPQLVASASSFTQMPLQTVPVGQMQLAAWHAGAAG
jgi:hypothetical protein